MAPLEWIASQPHSGTSRCRKAGAIHTINGGQGLVAHLADRIHPGHALSDKHINLPQLRDNLFRLVSLVCHSRSSVC